MLPPICPHALLLGNTQTFSELIQSFSMVGIAVVSSDHMETFSAGSIPGTFRATVGFHREVLSQSFQPDHRRGNINDLRPLDDAGNERRPITRTKPPRCAANLSASQKSSWQAADRRRRNHPRRHRQPRDFSSGEPACFERGRRVDRRSPRADPIGCFAQRNLKVGLVVAA